MSIKSLTGLRAAAIVLLVGGFESFVAMGAQSGGPSAFVDPMIGSQGAGGVAIGPSMPFGMAKPSPDVGDNGSNSGWKPEGDINGFSHTHVSGTGGGAKYGNILVMPVTGPFDPQKISSPRANEEAVVGRYSVDLTRHGVHVDVTCSERAALYRFRFPAREGQRIVFDAAHFLYNNIAGEGQILVDAKAKAVSPREVEGSSSLRGGWNLQKEPFTVYFYAVADTAARETGAFESKGKPAGAWLAFDGAKERTVNLKVGISFKSVAAAKRHAETIAGFDFDTASRKVVEAWDKALGTVRVETPEAGAKKVFYTALYHAMLMPVDRTGDNPLWESDEPYYDDFYAIWDTFRTSGPLLTLVAPERQAKIIRALVDIQRHEGFLPDGRSGNCNGRVQGGSDADVYIADAYVKGLPGVDWEAAYQAVKADAENEPADGYKEGRGGIADWKELGYLSMEGFGMSGCKNVEYAYNDYCVMEMAVGLGHAADAAKYAKRATQWRNVWDERTEDAGFSGFIRPRHRDGRWMEQFKATDGCSWGGHTFYEGNSWTYSFYVPHDVPALILKCGGSARFVERLDALFDGRCDFSNEPFFLTPYLYNYVGRQDKTAERVRQVLSRYSTIPWGVPGNDDSGALSAWYALSATGIFPVAGQDIYQIGSPIFSETAFTGTGGKPFVIRAENVSKENKYVKEMTLNGKPLQRPWIRHADIMAGGELLLKMGGR